MKRSRTAKVKKTRLLVFGTLSLIIIGYFAFILVFYLYNIGNNNIKMNNKKSELTELKRQEKMLSNEIEKLKEPSYIAKYAREHYAYSKDGEIIIKIKEKDKKKEENNKFNLNIDYTYFIYGGGILLFIIFICIIKKK